MADETMTLEEVRYAMRQTVAAQDYPTLGAVSEWADAIESAIAERKVADGWQLVPIEPTVEMCDAWVSVIYPDTNGLSGTETKRALAGADWRVMLAAAPNPQSPRSE